MSTENIAIDFTKISILANDRMKMNALYWIILFPHHQYHYASISKQNLCVYN